MDRVGKRGGVKAKRRGVAEIIGGLFVIIIIALGAAAIIFVSQAENGVNVAENNVAQIDSQKSAEALSIPQVFFGGSATYSPSQTYVTTAGCIDRCGVTMTNGSEISWAGGGQTGAALNHDYPVYAPFSVTSGAARSGTVEALSNMNFTNGASGWTVVTRPIGVPGAGLVGGFDPTYGNPVPGSGVGAAYVGGMWPNRPSVTTGDENLSTRFYVNVTQAGAITGASFSYARYVPQESMFGANVACYTVNVFVRNEGTAKTYLISTATYSQQPPPGVACSGPFGDSAWQYTKGVTALNDGTPLYKVFSQTGYYYLTVQGVVTFDDSAHASCSALGQPCAEFFSFFDDIGLSYSYRAYTTDWYYTFSSSQAPSTVQQLAFSVAASYNQGNVLQYVYLKDWITGAFDLFAANTVGAGGTTVTVSLGITDTGQTSAQNYISSGGLTQVRVYSAAPQATGSTLVTTIGTVNGLTSTVAYSSTSQLSFTVSSTSSVPVHVVALVIVDSRGHHFFNSTTIPSVNVVVYPGETLSVDITYHWNSGSATLILVTSRGNFFVAIGHG